MSQKPKPHSFFGFVSFTQDVQHIFLLLSFPSHQKRVKADWILLHRLTGSSKQDIVCVGEADSTDFKIVIFPALDKYRLDQLAACCRILSTKEVNRSFFLRPKSSGRPRYLPCSLAIPRRDLTLARVSWDVYAEKVMDDLVELMVCPEAALYCCNIRCSVSQLSSSVPVKNIVSSANRR